MLFTFFVLVFKDKTSGIPGGYRLVSTYDLPDCKTILKFEILKFSNWEGVFFWDPSDLDSMTIFIGGGGYSGTPWIWTLWKFSLGGGVLWDTLDLDSITIFIWGDILGHLGFGLYDNFHLGGVFWDTLDLDSMTIFIWGGILGHLGFGLSQFSFGGGGYSGTPQIWTLWQFSFWGGILGHLGFGLSDIFILGGYSGIPQIWTLWQFSFWEEGEGEGEGGILQNRGILWDLDQNFNHSSRLMHHR